MKGSLETMKKIAFGASVAAVAVSAMLPLSVVADTLTWKGGATGQFSAPSNWTSANTGTTSTLGPQPGDTVKFTKIVGLDAETFDIGSAGLTIDNSMILTNKVVFTGSGKVVKKGNGELRVMSTCTHTGGTRIEAGLFNFNTSSIKTFGTGKIEVVRNGTSNNRAQLNFTPWGGGLTNEVEIIGAVSTYVPITCSNRATLSGPVSADGDFKISSGYGAIRFEKSISAPGKTVEISCTSAYNKGDNDTILSGTIDASLKKTGARTLRLKGNSPGIDNALTLTDGATILDAVCVWGGTNVVVSGGVTNVLTISAESNFSTPPVIRLLDGAKLNFPQVAVRVAELWIGDVRQEDGCYVAEDFPENLTGAGGLLIVGQVAGKVWTGGVSGLFSEGSNWSDGQPPAPGDTLIFPRTVNLEAEATDIGAQGMTFFVKQWCTVTNNNAFTGSGLLTKFGRGTFRAKVAMSTTGGIKVRDGSIYPEKSNPFGTGTIEIDATGGTAPLLDSGIWGCTVTNRVKVTGARQALHVIQFTNALTLTGDVESDSDFYVDGAYGPLTSWGSISAPGKTMLLRINGRNAANATSYLYGSVDCSVVLTSLSICGILEMRGVSSNVVNTLTVNAATNRLTATAYWGGTNVVVRKTDTFPAHLILQDPGNLNPEATLTLADGGTVEVASGKKVCVAHLVTDGVARRDGVYTASNLPGYILGGGRIQVGHPGTIIVFR